MGNKLSVGVNDLGTRFPEVSGEWDYERNAPLKPSDICAKSSKKVWWRCGRGHGWLAAVDNRTSGKGCPYCAGKLPIKGETDLATLRPDLCGEWDYDRNVGLAPSDFTVSSSTKVWWVDSRGNHWVASINSRMAGQGSPYLAGQVVSRTRLI